MHYGESVEFNHTAIATMLRRLAGQGIGPVTNLGIKAEGDFERKPDIVNLTTREIY